MTEIKILTSVCEIFAEHAISKDLSFFQSEKIVQLLVNFLTFRLSDSRREFRKDILSFYAKKFHATILF